MGVTALLMKLGLAEKLAKILGPVLIVAALAAALWWLRHDAYGDGVRAERAAWEQKEAKLKAQAEKLQRAADQLRASAEAARRQRITDQRTEVDNALGNIPDQAPSARQRARACLELRRQARAAGRPEPAC